MNSANVRIEVDGVVVHGRIVERSAGSVEVLLTEPHGELRLSDGRYVMAQALRFVTMAGQHGEDVATRLLRELYKVAVYVTNNRVVLEQRWAELRRQLHDRRPRAIKTQHELDLQRRVLRQRLKAGLVPPEEYQQTLRALTCDFEDFLFEEEDVVDVFWREAGFELSYDLQLQAINIIDPTLCEGARRIEGAKDRGLA